MKKRKLRSQDWFAIKGRQGFEHRSNMRGLGLPDSTFDGRPIIGICNVWSEFNPCDAGQRDLIGHVKSGVLEAGGIPLEFPAPAIGEPIMRPSPLMFRNLTSMVVEELIRANPIDGVVLLAGCDKTTPALLMGALSCDIPLIVVSSGPKINATFRGETLGSGTHIWQSEQDASAGTMSHADVAASEAAHSRSHGTCMTMGTASTMASIVEAMGLSLEYNSCIPAPDVRRALLARHSGRAIVQGVNDDRRPSTFLTRQSFENAIRTVAAIGGSSNAVIHLQAIAGRAKIPLTLDDWNTLGRDIPCLVDLMPAGRFLMDDFYGAGGLSVVIKRLVDQNLFDAQEMTVLGEPLAARLPSAKCFNNEVIRTFDNPVSPQGGLAVLKGNLAPDGAIIKPAAASTRLLKHKGKAIVFDDIKDYMEAASSETFDVSADDIMIIRNCGLKGYPGMPEVANACVPQKLLKEGVNDIIRISDARMSGTAFGSVILHVSPEAAVGGPLALVKNGDMIDVNVEQGSLNLLVSAEELKEREQALSMSRRDDDEASGYKSLFMNHVLQPDRGADFDFLLGQRGADTPREST
ncbi:MAG: dihydroxy-acid dehydratase [Pseudomonadota bacterium]